MANKELIDRSPIRFLENATNGGLKAGEMGAITSKKGLGKTSVLVQIGIDSLLQDKKIVHISFEQKTNSAMTWYEDIFNEITKRKNLSNPQEFKSELFKNRILLNFNQDIISGEQVVKKLQALNDSGIKIETLIIDGWDFARVTDDTIKILKDYAVSAKIVVWFGVSTNENELKKIFDKEILGNIDGVIHLEQKKDSISLNVLKLRNEKVAENNLKLDSKTLLLVEK